jgi:hypothetical protein
MRLHHGLNRSDVWKKEVNGVRRIEDYNALWLPENETLS